ncbi:isochorismatase family cysteine hydrolase [Roseobacter sp.]|uniref:cysteine hydrolase family protein n=1 Tax=Roseobacter sp. TaxID=1907202 RepID=UPI003297439E
MQKLQRHSHSDRWTPLDEGAAVSLLRPAPMPQPVRFAAEPKLVEADMARCALMIIDMQNDFLNDRGWFATSRNADVSCLSDVVGQINALSGAFRQIGSPVIHINWAVRPDAANLPANVLDKGSDCGARASYGDQIGSGRVLVDGDWGAQSVPAIDTAPNDISLGKTRLTGFRDNELDSILRRLGVTTLFFTGVNLDRCVFATLADGCFNGFDAVLVEDATTTVSPPHVTDAILYLIRLLYGFTAKSKDILAALSTHPQIGANS